MSGEKFASRTRDFCSLAMVNPCQKRSKRPCPQENKGPSPQRYYDPCPQGNTGGVKAKECYDEAEDIQEDCYGDAEDIQEDHGDEENESTEFLKDVRKVVDEHLNSELVHRLHFLGVHGREIEFAAATYELL
jgi:hypothetical protein